LDLSSPIYTSPSLANLLQIMSTDSTLNKAFPILPSNAY
jgi:hypothetical protein